ncbi:MAG: DUF5615 family PIN-like protein [Sporichthyaceae bacterium]
MRSSRRLRFLLDEHYPEWLAAELGAAGFDTVSVVASGQLRGVDDTTVLAFAAAERRVVVTEDVTTFTAAIAAVSDHVGVVFCHHARFPRTRPGLVRLRLALEALAESPPAGPGVLPVVWWLDQAIPGPVG